MCLSIILIDTTVHTPSDWTDWRGRRVYICTYISLRSVAFLLFAYANVAEILKRCGSMARKLILKYSQMYTVHMYVCMYVYHVYRAIYSTYICTYWLWQGIQSSIMLDGRRVSALRCHSSVSLEKTHTHTHTHTHTDRGTQIHTGISA